jgi:hypothetical protein
MNLISSLNIKLRNFKKYGENSQYLEYYKPSIGREYAKWITEEISEVKNIQTNIKKFIVTLSIEERSMPTK